MEDIVKTEVRRGNFSSSAIYQLTKNGRAKDSLGAPFYTYINEKRIERLAGRPAQNEASGPPLDWGNLCETFANDELGLDYRLVSQERFKHPELDWTGAPDTIKGDNEIVGDVKCPWTLTAYFKLYDCITGSDLKAAEEKYYWQLISNAILTGINTCELIVFMPKKSMIPAIQTASEAAGYWFHRKSVYEMPWTSDKSDIPVIHRIVFEAPEADKLFLTERVRMACEILNGKS